MNRGFFVPNSISGEYVSTKKTSEGDYLMDREVNKVRLNQQAGMQTLSKQYNTTIDKAYSNYLLANKGIRGSQMGQGYKEAYIQESQAQLQNQMTEINLDAAMARSQLGSQADQAIGNLNQMFETEVANMDRVSQSLGGYYDYLKGLTNKNDPAKTYFTEEESKNSLDLMYDQVMRAQPIDYLDAEGNIAISYIEWVQKNLKDTERDRTWGDWLLKSEGLNQFREAVKKGIKN